MDAGRLCEASARSVDIVVVDASGSRVSQTDALIRTKAKASRTEPCASYESSTADVEDACTQLN